MDKKKDSKGKPKKVLKKKRLQKKKRRRNNFNLLESEYIEFSCW